MNMTRPEVDVAAQKARHDLAACYRLAHHYRMTDLLATHISARIEGPGERILINPFGKLFDEVTASNLVEVTLDGAVVEPANGVINPAGYLIHSAVHAARPNVMCVMHTHTPNGVAVSCQEDGLLPISQGALIFEGRLSYHDYEGVALLDEERGRLQADLGGASAMILRNHGLLTVGRSVGEAFFLMLMLERACDVQIRAQSGGAALRVPPQEIRTLVKDQTERFANAGMGEREWVALLREVERIAPDYRD